MNLDDLRAQLRNQADEIDPATPTPLPAIARRRTTLKRRRAAAVIAGAAAAVALVVGVLPDALNNSAPDPAKPPPDYTRNGVTLPGAVGSDRLERPEIGKPGAEDLQFDWTPSGTSITFRPYCRTTSATPLDVKVTVNGRVMVLDRCDDSGTSPSHEQTVVPGQVVWLEAPPGKVATVRVFVVETRTGRGTGAAQQLALGIYRSSGEVDQDPSVAELPVRTLPPAPGDYIRDGVRFGAKEAGDTLLGAIVGDVGERSLKLRFTARSGSTGVRLFCTGNRAGTDPMPRMAIRVDGRIQTQADCGSSWSDTSREGFRAYPLKITPGRTVELTSELVDDKGEPMTAAAVRLGVGAYTLAPRRAIETSSGEALIDEVIDQGGYTYKLAGVQSVDAKSKRQVSITTPAERPYVIGYGALNLGGAEVAAALDGMTQEVSHRFGANTAALGPEGDKQIYGQPAGPAGTVTLKVVSGKPTQGLLYLALYLPE